MLCVRTMEFTDTLALDGMRLTGDGYLTASVKAARTGIQIYGGREVDPDNNHGLRDKAQVRVYRPADEVFNKDSMGSYAHRPVTIDHPPVAVTADNWRDYAVGMVGDEVARDGEFVRVPLVLMDAGAIKAVQGGKRELSQGYTCDLDFTAGKTDDGLEFDAVQRNIRANHTAVVGLARGGHELKIGDTAMTKMVTLDNHSVEVSDAAAILFDAIQAKLTAAEKIIADNATAAAKAASDAATKDASIASLTKELADAKAAIPTGDALDKLVVARAELIADAKIVGGDKLDITGDDAAIKKRAVIAKLGDSYKDQSAAFFDAAFVIERDKAKAGGTGVTDTLRLGLTSTGNAGAAVVPANMTDAVKARDEARAKMIADMQNPPKAA